MRFPRLMLLALVAALAMAACGGDSGGGDTGGDGGDGGTTTGTVTMVDNAFEPTTPSVASGESLELSNEGAAAHTFTLADGSIDESVDPGGTASVTVGNAPGSYDF